MLKLRKYCLEVRSKWAVLLAFILLGSACSFLQKNLGAPEYTPELKADEEDCTARAIAALEKKEEERGKKFIFLNRLEVRRVLYQECMRKKGYDHLGRKKEDFRVDHRDLENLEPPRGWKQYEETAPPVEQR